MHDVTRDIFFSNTLQTSHLSHPADLFFNTLPIIHPADLFFNTLQIYTLQTFFCILQTFFRADNHPADVIRVALFSCRRYPRADVILVQTFLHVCTDDQ